MDLCNRADFSGTTTTKERRVKNVSIIKNPYMKVGHKILEDNYTKHKCHSFFNSFIYDHDKHPLSHIDRMSKTSTL